MIKGKVVVCVTLLLPLAGFMGAGASVSPQGGGKVSFQDALMVCPLVQVDSLLIDEFTWAFMRYDHPVPSLHFGMIGTPDPTVGTSLVPMNMMAEQTCRIAVDLYQEDKSLVVAGLDRFDSAMMLHTQPAFFPSKDEWNTPNMSTYRKENVDEMLVLGDICWRAALVGDCYAQASLNTAMLRLCGFAAEEVFTVGIYGHAVNVIHLDDRWVVFDSTWADQVRKGMRDSLIFPVYVMNPPYDMLMFLENDKYFVNFGSPFPQAFPHLRDPYCNLNETVFMEVMEAVWPLFNYSRLGWVNWEVEAFYENATLYPAITTRGIPYTVADAPGSSPEEQAHQLAAMNKAFILGQCGGDPPNQYDHVLYAQGCLEVVYPQVYANAARYAAWTSRIAARLDTRLPVLDVLVTVLWVRVNCLRTQQLMPEGCVAFADMVNLRHAGSTLDQSLLAYGTLRNMHRVDGMWDPMDLQVVVTPGFEGYLMVNMSRGWWYLNFGSGPMIGMQPPDEMLMVFNECICNRSCFMRVDGN